MLLRTIEHSGTMTIISNLHGQVELEADHFEHEPDYSRYDVLATVYREPADVAESWLRRYDMTDLYYATRWCNQWLSWLNWCTHKNPIIFLLDGPRYQYGYDIGDGFVSHSIRGM